MYNYRMHETIGMTAELSRLADIFGENGSGLYLVGGYVRDSLLGRPSYDIDICSDIPPTGVCALLKDSEFSIPQRNMPLGTLIIVCGAFRCEYTCFRTESYRVGGGHTPENVVFPASMQEDALRRDFTVNAIYYDISCGRVVDPLEKGLEDLEHKIIKTTRDPKEVFSEDPLRIMRLCRIAGTLGFSVDESTYSAARELSYLVGTLTRHRIGDEFLKLLEAKGSGLVLLYDTGTAAIISQHISRQACASANEAGFDLPVALALLFGDLNPEDAIETMKGLAVPLKVVDLASFLIMNKGFELSSGDKLKLDIAEMGIERARYLVEYLNITGNPSSTGLKAAMSSFIKSGAPMSMQELAITGRDIIESFGASPGPELGRMLHDAYCYAVLNPEKNTAENLIQYLSNGLDG